jgi:hypothetical protein
LSFFREKSAYLAGFHRKWVEPGEQERRILLSYEDFMQCPVDSLSKVISFIEPDRDIDVERIRAAAADVRETRDAMDFRFYDSSLNDHLASLGIEPHLPTDNSLLHI